MKTVSALIICCFFSPAVWAIDPRADIESAMVLISEGRHELARTYLAPALIAPQIHSSERSRAYYFRGFSYLAESMPVSARKDFHRALEFNPNNQAALVSLGRIYSGGQGVEADAELGFELFSQAAQLGYTPALFHQGYAYLLGQGVAKDLIKAREILAQAADQGHGDARMSLAASYRPDHVTTPEPQQAEHWYQRAYESGRHEALLAMAYMKRDGEFGDADPVGAFQLFEQAAAEGVAAAHVSLGYAYLVGEGTDAQPKAAYEAYLAGANAGLPEAYLGLGHLYEHGIGVKADVKKSSDWYLKAAYVGNLDAQLRLVGVFLAEETEAGYAEAVSWARRATDSGQAQAYNDYAWMLATAKYDPLRNGVLAVNQAEKAVDLDPIAPYLDTLAAAYAETGNFVRAVEVQEQALKALTEAEADLRGELETRLQYYLRNEPWRE